MHISLHGRTMVQAEHSPKLMLKFEFSRQQPRQARSRTHACRIRTASRNLGNLARAYPLIKGYSSGRNSLQHPVLLTPGRVFSHTCQPNLTTARAMERSARDCRHQDALVECHMCGARMQSENLDEHLSMQCPKRIYRCHYCGQYEGEYEEVEQKHYPKCERFPLPCCNPHCALGHSIPRMEYADHMKSEYCALVS